MTEPAKVTRARALGFRVHRQQLVVPAGRVDDAAVVGVGVQDTPRGSALLALRARVATPPGRLRRALDDGGALVLALTVRGAPHVVARRDLPLLTAALRPDGGRDAADGELVADAMRSVLGAGRTVTKPELSEGLNALVPDRLRSWCERCEARHVPEGLFRRATLWAGLTVDPEASPVRFVRPEAAPAGDTGRASDTDPPADDGDGSGGDAEPPADEARAELVRRFVRLAGPTRPDQLARWLDVDGTRARALWGLVAGELVRVDVDGQRSWALAADAAELTGGDDDVPDVAEVVRLLPAGDPYLLGDRNRLVPAREHRSAVWRPVGGPGVVLAGPDLVGTWRHRLDGAALAVTVTPFAGLRRVDRAALRHEAESVAAVRGVSDMVLTVDDAR